MEDNQSKSQKIRVRKLMMAVERWTDEMLDELASSVSEMRDSVDGLRVTTQALLQVAAQNQRKMDQFEEKNYILFRRNTK